MGDQFARCLGGRGRLPCAPALGYPAASLWPAPRPPRYRARRADPGRGQRWPTPLPGRPISTRPCRFGGVGARSLLRQPHLLGFCQAGEAVGHGTGRPPAEAFGNGGGGQRPVLLVLAEVGKNKAIKLAGTKALPIRGGHGYRLLRPWPAPPGSCRRYPRASS